MLLELKVNNLAIIDNVHIQFKKGLNILTGETGAGKSILLKSLALLMGSKGQIESIRSGCTSASVEGSFDLKNRNDLLKKLAELGIEAEDHLLVVKRIIAEDRSRVYLNGSLSNLNMLREIVSPLIEVTGSAPLIEMTGQFENRNLLSKSYHLDLLDQYLGNWEARNQYQTGYKELKQIEQEIIDLKGLDASSQQKLDYLEFQRNEINEMDLSPGEDIVLEEQIKKLKNLSRLQDFLETCEDLLLTGEDSATHKMTSAIRRSTEIAVLDSNIGKIMETVASARIIIEDSMFELRNSFRNLEEQDQSLEDLESRLSRLRKLQKKYGPSIDDILAALLTLETEISKIKNAETKIVELQKKQIQLTQHLEKLAGELHKKRTGGATVLENSVNNELKDLNMKGVSFSVQLTELNSLSPTGMTETEFLSQNSAKDTPRPLAKVSSGGELSRILLSLKQVIGASKHPRTYLFDEVDTGVSGPTAEKVGKKLSAIAKGQQVICVTHLPQVAAYGDHHFLIQKSQSKGLMLMDVSELKTKDRVQEIARLISGEKISKTSLAHAEQLLQSGK